MLPKWFLAYRPHVSWIEFNQNLEVDLLNDYVYFEVAKVACSTIKSRLRTVAAPGIPMPNAVHPAVLNSPFSKPFQLPPRIMRNVLSGTGFTRFTFVREPVERVVSAYLDKMCREDKDGNRSEQRKRFMAAFLPDKAQTDEVSFDQFVDIIAEVEDSRLLDKHWRPQADLMFQPVQEFDFIGRFDRFEDDWDKLAERLELPVKIERTNVTWHSTSAGSKVDDIVTPNARRKIEARYAKDFELYASIE